MRLGDIVGDRFQLEHLAGSGGMGEVYKALDRETGQPVAVKSLTDTRKSDAARFAREARILAELDHPHIVRYIAHGALDSGEPYLAMEWLEGEDLSARLSRERLSAEGSIALALRVAEALGFAHARGVVHRDLKPSNIYLQGGALDATKLLDFGIAQLGAGTRMTKTGMLVGTPGYMAPEQARGGERLDARADVFSLGCVLYECLTGEPAFRGAHLVAVLARILFDEPPRVLDKRPELPDALSALIDRMLAKRPEDRPPDGHAVAEALRALGEIPSLISSTPAGQGALVTKALTGSEQRAVAVILIGAQAQKGDQTLEASPHEALVSEAEIHGGHFEPMLNGSAAVVLSSTTVATDLAAQAARCALALRARAPGRAIALALGRSETTGRLPMGPAIDQAARLVGGSTGGGGGAAEALPIVLDEVTAGLLDAHFDVRELEAGFVLHGERELGVGTRTLLGMATPCVGRDWELGTLERLFDECLEERVARVVLVTAPAGAGKTRLGQEFLRHVTESSTPVAVWYGRGDPLRAGSAFGLLRQCLRRACGILDGEPLDVRRQKVLARVRVRVAPREQQRVTEFLAEIIGTPFPDDESLPLRAARKDAHLMNDQMRSAFLDFLAAECKAGPVMIGFEDLHWGDRPTVQFLDRALKDLRDQPLFVIALSRPEVYEIFPKLWIDRGLMEIRLKQLNRKAIERLARHVLRDRADRETIDRLERLSEGNAFYLEELIRWAAEGRGADLPNTVVAMVQSRLGALSDDARRVLRAASVFGEAFWVGGVTSLLGGAERAAAARERLSALVEQEVIIKRPESRLTGEEELAFRHALLREGAYALLTDEDKALGHRLAGEWLEQHGEQDALVLAEHFEKGGDTPRAGHFYLRAAAQASTGNDMLATIAHARRGLARPVPEALRIRLLGALSEASFWHLESLSAVVGDVEELLSIAERASLPWVQGMLAKMNIAMRAGRFDEVRAMLGVLREIDATPETTPALGIILASGIYLLNMMGRPREGDALMERLTTIARAAEDRDPVASIPWRGIIAMRSLYAHQDPWSGLLHIRSARTLADAVGHRRYLEHVRLTQGIILWSLGALAEAERALTEFALPDEELAFASHLRPFSLAWVLADRGAFDEARAWASRLVASGQARRLRVEEGQGRWMLAEVLRRTGDLDAADAEIAAAIAIIAKAAPMEHPGALATLAALRLAQGRPPEALAAAQEGMARAESMGACSYFFRGAFLHLTHAECLEASGEHAAARAAIAKARQWILAVADKIGDPAYRKTYLEDVPENARTLEIARQWLGEGE